MVSEIGFSLDGQKGDLFQGILVAIFLVNDQPHGGIGSFADEFLSFEVFFLLLLHLIINLEINSEQTNRTITFRSSSY